MIKEQILALVTLVSTALLPVSSVVDLAPVLAEHTLDLTSREPNPYANEVFADNILLSLHYLKGDVALPVNWEEIRQPFAAYFTLAPGEVFAFHEDVLPEFKDKVAKTTGAHFNWQDGFRSDGWLVGDGVCHLATLMNWVASEAGLRVVSPANHDFLPVPGVAREYGTSILWHPDGGWRSQNQNLYVQNTFDYPVKFNFKVTTTQVDLTLSK